MRSPSLLVALSSVITLSVACAQSSAERFDDAGLGAPLDAETDSPLAADAGGKDAGSVDAAMGDAPSGDSSASDATVGEGGSVDASSADASSADAGVKDGGVADSGVVDAGADAGGSVWETPTCDGVVSAAEYGGSQNQYTTAGGQTWSMTWDGSNLYVAIESAKVGEAAVMYLGVASSTITTGQTYDSTNYASLTFDPSAVFYAKDTYNEVRLASGSSWGAATSSALTFCGTGTTRELVVPWSALGLKSIASDFRWVGYVTSSTGYVYGQLPETLPGGFIGTSATFPNDYYVGSTSNGTGSFPFSKQE